MVLKETYSLPELDNDVRKAMRISDYLIDNITDKNGYGLVDYQHRAPPIMCRLSPFQEQKT